MLKKWNRIGANVIDFSIIMMIIRITYTILVLLTGKLLVIKGGGNTIDLFLDILKTLFTLSWAVFIAVFYNVFLQLKFTNTVGRLFLRVHVIDEKSTNNNLVEANGKQLIKREVYKWVFIIGSFNIYAFYALIKIIFSDNPEFYYNKTSKTKVEVWV